MNLHDRCYVVGKDEDKDKGHAENQSVKRIV